jgi:putative ABC transport system permease protein
MLEWRVQGRNRREQDLDDEIGYDLELEVEEQIRSGMSRQAAERSARLDFGNLLSIKEDTRETWGWTWIERFGQDLRYAARTMRRSPAFSLAALLSLGLGVGVTTAVFSVVYGLLLAPYPYAKPNEIWGVQISNAKNPREWVPLRLSQYLEIKKLPAFSDVMASSGETEILTGERPAESLHAMLLSGNAFQFLGAPALLGRAILPSDIKPNGKAESVVVLSYKAWQRWFLGDVNALGKTLLLNDRPHTVIGVMQPRFGWYGDMWLPLPVDLRPDRIVFVGLRLRPGVSKDSAEQALHADLLRLARENPKNFPKEGFTTSLWNQVQIKASADMRYALWWLILVVGFLLLISCANVANLQLARATVRSREIAVRISVGAGQGRVLRQLLTESVLLSLAGGALGVLFSVTLVPAIVALMPVNYERPSEAHIAVNGYVLLFSVAVSLLTGILSGLAPALQCSRPNLAAALQDASRNSGANSAGGRTRNLLVIAEVALSMILLFAASETVRGFLRGQNRERGFQPVRVLTAGLPLRPKRYVTYQSRIAFDQSLLERVKRLPGVQSAAIGDGGLFFFGGPQSGFSIPGRPQPTAQRVSLALISPDYTRTLGIPLRGGRGLTEQEIVRADRVGLVNEMASRLWKPGENPIGTTVRLDFLEKPGASYLSSATSTPYVTIVGVIADTRSDAELGTTRAPLVLVPYTLLAPPFRKLYVRTQGKPTLLFNAVKQEVKSIDKDQPVIAPAAVEESLSVETAQGRFDLALFGFVAVLGLALAAAGISGVLFYSATRRTHEIAVRMALGATRRDVLSQMLGRVGRLVLIGMVAGTLGTFLLSACFGRGGAPVTEPLAIAAVVAVLSTVAVLACYLSARRVACLDPTVALRHE